MTTKLHINISQGVIDIEGDPDLVREIYADFKAQLLSGAQPAATSHETSEEPQNETADRPKAKRRPATRKKASSGSEESGPSVVADSPKLDKNLDTAGLPAFYDRYETKNNAEKILVFLKFINDELNIESPSTDQFYTCFEKVNERIPKVFSQAFRDASGRKFGYIDYNSPTDIKITTVGNNHFKFDLKKKPSE